MFVLGCDPGTQGALCLLDTSTNSTRFYETPKSKYLAHSVLTLSSQIALWFPIIAYTAIEDVHSMGGMSAKSNFQFGRNVGLLEACLYSHIDNIEYIQPKVWQKEVGISFTPKSTPAAKKKITANIALELYPKAEIFGPKGGLLDGRSDALMIAHYLKLTREVPDVPKTLV